MLPEVSVLMPVYNGEKHIESAVFSILNQSFDDLELIIIDDGSTDNTSQIIKKIKDKRIRFFSNGSNRGLPYTRNRGLKLCRGRYIAFMDSDDISHEDRLKIQLKHFYKHPHIDIISSTKLNIENKNISVKKLMTENFSMQNKIKYFLRKSLHNVYETPNSNIMLLYRCMIVNPSSMVKKSFITKNNLSYRDQYFVAQDYSFWMDCMLKNAKFKILQYPLVYYRTGDGYENITNMSRKFKSKERKLLISSIRTRGLEETNLLSDFRDLTVFNKFFQEKKFIVNENNVKILKKTLHKLKINNKKNEVFPVSNFNYVAQLNWVNQVVNTTNLNKKKKIIYLLMGRWFSKNPKAIAYTIFQILKLK